MRFPLLVATFALSCHANRPSAQMLAPDGNHERPGPSGTADGRTADPKDPSGNDADSIIHLYHDQVSDARYALRAVVRDSGTFAQLWRQITGARGGPPPAIDFDRYMIIAVAMGARGSTGHDISVSGVKVGSGILRVQVRLSAPGQRCLAGGMITHPANIVRVANSPLMVTFMEALSETRC